MLAILLVGTAALSVAQAVTLAPVTMPRRPQVWDVEWEEPNCTVTTGSSDGSALMLSMMPGAPEPTLYFMQSGTQTAAKAGDAATITLEPSGKTVQAMVWPVDDRTRHAVQIGSLGIEFPKIFALSSSISVKTAKRQMSMSIPGADKAMAAIRECLDKKLTEWGIDAAAYDALQKPPAQIKGYDWIDPNSYPMDAIMAHWSGDVIARMTVDATGKVSDCKIVISGGMPSMDAVTCNSALKRGRFEPAIGTDGKPTAAFRIVDVSFRIM